MLTHIEFLRNFERYREKSIYLLVGPESYPIKTIFEKLKNYERKLFYVEESSTSDILDFLKLNEIFNKSKKLAVIKDIDFKKAEKQWKFLFKEFEKIKIWQLLEKNGHKIIIYSNLGFFEDNVKKLENFANEFISKNITNSKNYLIILMPYLNKDERRAWVLKKLKQLNIKISLDKFEKLFQILPPDLHTWNKEIEKIYLLDNENIDLIVSTYKEAKIYDFINYLERHELSNAIKLFENTNYIEANSYILRTLLNLLYTYENLDEFIKPEFLKKRLQKLNRNYEKSNVLNLIYLSLLTDKTYKTFHRGKLSILRLLYHIFEKAHRQ